MRNFLPRSLYAKICVIFLLVLFLYTSISVLLAATLYKDFGLKKTQKMHWDLADEVAKIVQPLLTKAASVEELRLSIDSIQNLNPRIGVLLLDKDGEVKLTPQEKAYIRVIGKTLNTQRIEEFLEPKANRSLPLFIDDPSSRGKNIFSASRVHFSDGSPGYILVLLQGAKWQVYEKAFQERYLILGGLATFLILFTITSVVGLFLFRLITKRLGMLRTAVEDVSSGNLSVRVEGTGSDEIALICQGFNKMADTIEEKVFQLRKMDEQRRTTFAGITHDMGTPLTSLQGHLGILENKGAQLPTQVSQKHISSALKSARQLSKFKDEIFELAKIESQNNIPEFEKFSLADLVSEEVIPILKPLADKHQIEIEYHGAESVGLVFGVEEWIKRVFLNLVENAIRYGDPGGRVDIRLEQSGAKITVKVEDNGCGIAPEDLDNIFNEFYRSDDARRANDEGTGLGLAIAKKIVEVHGSTINVSSKLGEGTVFTFQLAV